MELQAAFLGLAQEALSASARQLGLVLDMHDTGTLTWGFRGLQHIRSWPSSCTSEASVSSSHMVPGRVPHKWHLMLPRAQSLDRPRSTVLLWVCWWLASQAQGPSLLVTSSGAISVNSSVKLKAYQQSQALWTSAAWSHCIGHVSSAG